MDNNVLFQKFVTFTAAVHQITADFTKEVKLDDITPVQYKILEYIAVSQPVTLSEISDCMHMSMPNTSRELRKLSERHLCKKITDEEDRRKQYIHLSEDGEALMSEAFGHIEARLSERISHLSQEELKQVEQALDLLQDKVFN